MPLYPFILLVAILALVVIVPPLVAAYIDDKKQGVVGRYSAKDGKNQAGAGNSARRDGDRG